MDLSGVDLESSREKAARAKAQEQHAEQGDDCTLLFTLPGKQKASHKFKTGVTVAYVKAQLAEAHGLEFAKLKLLLGGKLMIDPLSLADCKGIAPGKEVEVEVSLG
ncbi:hypothetical protein HYH03_006268 [Edaphochlamys debaryana]|uniref:Ubiquitin-like domain-containing protein n=1 Tax=Edaphochlamys debaryana TaxID=47281 RepID=A0A835Y6K0_9CHLO|nr:hypothetical protein HYH03_006268 [Edaphochlamys debaryana]|eukprot:KAG2495668.1 hypothetical protein HYH03_006268 [Edaphochlamys debaryana]